jgi:hypothetical protein
MQNFLVVYKRHPFDIDIQAIGGYLIAEPMETRTWKSKDDCVLFVSFEIRPQAETVNFVSDPDSAIVFEGFPLLDNPPPDSLSYERELLAESKRRGAAVFDLCRGEYCMACYTDGEMHVGANTGGSHCLFYTTNNHLVAFSNRSALLLGLPHVSHALDVYASAWKCYQGYISGTGTHFGDIHMVPIGSTFTVEGNLTVKERKTRYFDLVSNAQREQFEQHPIDTLETIYEGICDYLRKLKSRYPGLALSVPLSGGKDSRLILALLIKAGLRDHIGSIWTRGPLYSPDVIASQKVCWSLGLPPPEIIRPATISKSDVSARLIINSLSYLEGNLSLYDFQGVRTEKCLTFRGHLNLLRSGGSFKKCRTDSLAHFLIDSLEARMHDPLGVLSQEWLDRVRAIYSGYFEGYAADEGAPLSALGELYYFRDRNLNFVSLFCNSDYYSGPVSNPLLLGDLARFSFSVPDEVSRYELFHYYKIKLGIPDCLSVPFANQTWDPGIILAAKRLGDRDKVAVVPPFRSHRDFPNVANPYVSAIKVDYMNAMKNCMSEFAVEHRQALEEFMRVDVFLEKLQIIRMPSFRDLYCALGIYSDLIVREYGAALFNRKSQPEIIADLESRISPNPSFSFSKNDRGDTNETYEDIIRAHGAMLGSGVSAGTDRAWKAAHRC